jgi:ElaB/YqjD/DUF883 family membrane-anchored ribosome-binding protein
VKKGNILFGWEDLIAGQPLKKLTAAFDAAGATIVSSSSDGKAKRTAGVSYKTLDIAFADSQQIELQVKQTGDVFQVKLNGQVVPLKNPDDHKAAIKELVAKMDAGRAKFQKKLTMVRAELPKGTKSVAPQKAAALAARVSELDAAINEATAKRDALKAEVAAVMDSVDEIFDAAHDYSDDELEEMQKWFDDLPKSAQERVMSGGVMIDKKAGFRAASVKGKLRITTLDSANEILDAAVCKDGDFSTCKQMKWDYQTWYATGRKGFGSREFVNEDESETVFLTTDGKVKSVWDGIMDSVTHPNDMKKVKYSDLKKGMWIIDRQNARFNRRVVSVGGARDGGIRLETDFGNGGEPAVSFYGKDDYCYSTDDRPVYDSVFMNPLRSNVLDYAGQPRDTNGQYATGKQGSLKAKAQHVRFAVKRAFSNPFRK